MFRNKKSRLLIRLLAVTCLLTFVALAYVVRSEAILEAKDVRFFKTEVFKAGGSESLRISGLAFHSALAVEKLGRKEDGNTLRLKIYLVLARRGLSGSFDYTIELPSNIAVVTFGSENAVIWRKDNSLVPK